jgi:hypothetical protein
MNERDGSRKSHQVVQAQWKAEDCLFRMKVHVGQQIANI